MSMYISMCISMYMYMYVCICIFVCMCVYMCICVYVFMCVRVYAYMCICVLLCICVYVYYCVIVYMCICVYIYIYEYACVCIHTYIYIFTVYSELRKATLAAIVTSLESWSMVVQGLVPLTNGQNSYSLLPLGHSEGYWRTPRLGLDRGNVHLIPVNFYQKGWFVNIKWSFQKQTWWFSHVCF